MLYAFHDIQNPTDNPNMHEHYVAQRLRLKTISLFKINLLFFSEKLKILRMPFRYRTGLKIRGVTT